MVAIGRLAFPAAGGWYCSAAPSLVGAVRRFPQAATVRDFQSRGQEADDDRFRRRLATPPSAAVDHDQRSQPSSGRPFAERRSHRLAASRMYRKIQHDRKQYAPIGRKATVRRFSRADASRRRSRGLRTQQGCRAKSSAGPATKPGRGPSRTFVHGRRRQAMKSACRKQAAVLSASDRQAI